MLRYGFFDSEITGYDEEGMPIFDRAESSDFLATFISKLITDGVLALPSDCFQVVAYEGMSLKVKPGFGIVRGRFALDTNEFVVEVPKAHTVLKRVDRVVLRANYPQRLCEIVVKEGTPSASPSPPELLRPESGDFYELCLATISLNSNQTVITQSHITDTRYDSSVCGVVTQAIDHLDTAVFFDQLNTFYAEFVEQCGVDFEEFTQMMKKFEDEREEAFDIWFESIKKKLDQADVAKIMAMLESHIGNKDIHVTVEDKNAWNNKLDKTGESNDNIVIFESEDTEKDENADDEGAASKYPEGWTYMPLLESGKSHASLFKRVSIVFKNLRYIGKLLGGTDISSIGDGTVTGALGVLNSNIADIITGNFSGMKSGDSIKLPRAVRVDSFGIIFPMYNNISTVQCIFVSQSVQAGIDILNVVAYDTKTQSISTSTTLAGRYVVLPNNFF